MVSATLFNLSLSFGIRSHDLSHSKLQVLFLLTVKSFCIFSSKEYISVQFSRSVVSNSWRPHGPQDARLPDPSPTPGVHPNPCPLCRWCHSTISFCHPLLLLLSNLPSIRVFSNESALRIRWPKYWSFSFSISPSNEYSVLISFRMDWFHLLVFGSGLQL